MGERERELIMRRRQTDWQTKQVLGLVEMTDKGGTSQVSCTKKFHIVGATTEKAFS